MLSAYIRHAGAHLIKQNQELFCLLFLSHNIYLGSHTWAFQDKKKSYFSMKKSFFITTELCCLIVTFQ